MFLIIIIVLTYKKKIESIDIFLIFSFHDLSFKCYLVVFHLKSMKISLQIIKPDLTGNLIQLIEKNI